MGAEVRALVFYNSWNEIGWLKDIRSKFLNEIVSGDVRDATTARWLRVRLCHAPIQPYAIVTIMPRGLMETNIIGALNILGMQDSDSLTRLVNVSHRNIWNSSVRAN